jgi:hypothetical protein
MKTASIQNAKYNIASHPTNDVKDKVITKIPLNKEYSDMGLTQRGLQAGGRYQQVQP